MRLPIEGYWQSQFFKGIKDCLLLQHTFRIPVPFGIGIYFFYLMKLRRSMSSRESGRLSEQAGCSCFLFGWSEFRIGYNGLNLCYRNGLIDNNRLFELSPETIHISRSASLVNNNQPHTVTKVRIK